MTEHHHQQGIGLIEAMIALALLVFTAMAMGQLQTSNLVSAQASSVHFAIDHLTAEIISTLRAQPSDARGGLFDTEGSVESTTSASAEVNAWNNRIAETIPTGVGAISCSNELCDVSISWIEEIDGSDHRQFYRTRTPL